VPQKAGSLSQPLLRTDAIKRLGVHYTHSGDWLQPVIEVIGAEQSTTNRLSLAFSDERSAVAHVRALAFNHAEGELRRIDGLLSARNVRLKLWLARNWLFFRDQVVGLVRTETILDQRRREALALQRHGIVVDVVRLPYFLRTPPILDTYCKVWLVDSRGFPSDAARLVETEITTRMLEQPDPGFDIGLRFKIDGYSQTFRADLDRDTHIVLRCNDPDVVGYCSRDIADAMLDSLAIDGDGPPELQDALKHEYERVRDASFQGFIEDRGDLRIPPAQTRHLKMLFDRVARLTDASPLPRRLGNYLIGGRKEIAPPP